MCKNNLNMDMNSDEAYTSHILLMDRQTVRMLS